MNNPDTYELLLEHGVPPVWAERLSRQPENGRCLEVFNGCLFHFVCGFARWAQTEEGHAFWAAVAMTVAGRGVEGLSQHATPWAE